MRNFIFVLILLLGGNPIVFADSIVQSSATGDSEDIIIDATIDLSFVPTKAYFLLTNSKGDVFKREGIVTSALSNGEVGVGVLSRYLIGTHVKKIEEVVSYSVLLFGDNNAYSFVPPTTLSDLYKTTELNSSDRLRDLVLGKKEVLESRKENLNKQTVTLKQLRISAAQVTEIAKIIELEEESKRVRDASKELEEDILSLKTALEVVKSVSHPYRFESRKAQLTTQLAEMADVALKAEQGADKRKMGNELSVDQKLALIDSTRFEDLGELEREYERLMPNTSDSTISESDYSNDSIDNTTSSVGDTESRELIPNGQPNANDAIKSEEYFSLSEG